MSQVTPRVEVLTEAGWTDITASIRRISLLRHRDGERSIMFDPPTRGPRRFTAEYEGKSYTIYEADS